MSASLWDLSAAELRDRTASASPTPGGGSIASVAGTLGASLLVMAAEITQKSAADAAPLTAWLTEAREVLAVLSRHADRDVEAFEAYMAAAGLPKSTDAEKSARKAALGAAALGAANAPLDAARDMVRALDLGVRIASLTKKAVASDVLAGSDLLGGAVIAALRNVDVNLGAISDEGERKRLAEERDGLLDKAEASLNEIRRILAVSR